MHDGERILSWSDLLRPQAPYSVQRLQRKQTWSFQSIVIAGFVSACSCHTGYLQHRSNGHRQTVGARTLLFVKEGDKHALKGGESLFTISIFPAINGRNSYAF